MESVDPFRFRNIKAGLSGEFKLHSVFSILHQSVSNESLSRKEGLPGVSTDILIPDTVTFYPGHPGQPAWYLSSKVDAGAIKRKNTQNVTPRNILDAFTRQRNRRSMQQGRSSGIVAVLIADAAPNPGITAADEIGEATVEYLDEVLLRDFLERRAPQFSGLLQKWVDPQGPHNSVLHASWTPALCRVSCRTNLRTLADRRCSMYDRAVTFDGADAQTRSDRVSDQTRERVVRACAGIARHAALVTDGRCVIKGLTAYLKLRHDGRLVLLWCSSAQLAPATSDGPPPLGARAYSPALIVPHEADERGRERARTYVCPVSNRVCREHDATAFISYRVIIAEWNARFPADPAGQARHRPSSARHARSPPPPDTPGGRPRPASARASGDGAGEPGAAGLAGEKAIPPLIRRLENVGDADVYRRLLGDPAFLYKQVRRPHVAGRGVADDGRGAVGGRRGPRVGGSRRHGPGGCASGRVVTAACGAGRGGAGRVGGLAAGL